MASTDLTAQSLNISVASRLMTNYESGSPVNHDREIAAAQDKDGNLIFFSIGSDRHLYLLSKDSGSKTGWKRTDLSQELGTTIEALHLATARDRDGNPILSAAFRDPARPNTTLLFHTKDFTATTASRWVPRGNMSGVDITHITTGAAKTGQVLIAVSTQKENQTVSYLVNPDPADTSWFWKEIPMPLQSNGVIDMAIGHHARLETIAGVDALLYMLLKIDDTTSKLITTSLPDFTYFNHEMPLDANPSAFGLIAGKNGGSELFVGNNALIQLSPKLQVSKDATAIQNNRIQVGKTPLPHPIKKVVNGRTQDGKLEVWFLTEDGVLYFSQEEAPGQFAEPLPLQRNIGQLTALRNEQTDAIDLFVVNLDNELIHLWQDQTTTRWKQQQILLEGINNALEFHSYTTQITLTDEDNAPVAGKTFIVRASELTQVTINGKTYFIDQATDFAECESDARGQIVIVNKVTKLTSPVIRLEAAFLNKAIDINPGHEIKQKIAQLSVDDLKNATLQTSSISVSEPLFKDSTVENLEGAYQAIQELIKLHGTLPSNGSEFNANVSSVEGGQDSIYARDRGSDFSHQLAIDALPADYTWGLDLTGATPTFSNQKAHVEANFLAASHATTVFVSPAAIDDVFSTIGHAFGDLWETVKNGFVSVTHLVIQKVEDGIQIIINGVDTAIHAVVKFAEQVWDVIQYVFEKIGAGFDELVRWLGIIFNWQDILNTHTALRSMAGLTFNHLMAQTDQLEDIIKSSFGQIREHVVGQNLASDRSNEIFSQRPKGAARHQDISNFLKPESNWAYHTLGNNLGAAVAGTAEFVGELTQVLIDTLATEGLIIQNAMQEVMKDIIDQYDRLSFEEILKRLALVITEALINSVENIALSFVQVAEVVARAIWAILNVRWDIPIITPLYETIIAPGSEFTLLDLGCLITAIPGTVIYKAAFHHAPFSPQLTSAIVTATDFDQLLQRIAVVFHPSTLPSESLISPAEGVFSSSSLRAMAPNEAMLATAVAFAPTIAHISPTRAAAGDTITITGTNLAGATAVLFPNNVSGKIHDNSDTEITVKVPINVTQGPIVVTTPAGTATSAERFEYDGVAIVLAGIQGTFGFLMGATKLGAGIAYDVAEYADYQGNAEGKKYANEVKFTFDAIGYIMAFVNATIYTATKKPHTPRQIIDVTMQQYLQLLPRIKDAILVFYWHKTNEEFEFREQAAWAESAFGGISFMASVASTTLQALEDPFPVSQKDADTLLGLKATHNLCAGTSQMLSGPKTAITRKMMESDPVLAAVKLTLISVRGGIATLVLPALTLARAGLNLTVHEQFLDGNAGS
jgi:hypothetical protein